MTNTVEPIFFWWRQQLPHTRTACIWQQKSRIHLAAAKYHSNWSYKKYWEISFRHCCTCEVSYVWKPRGAIIYLSFTAFSPFSDLHYFVFNWRKKGSTFHEASFLLCMLSHSHVWRHIIYLVVPTVTPAATQAVSRGLTALNCSLLVSAVVKYIHMSNYWVTSTKHSSGERYFFH